MTLIETTSSIGVSVVHILVSHRAPRVHRDLFKPASFFSAKIFLRDLSGLCERYCFFLTELPECAELLWPLTLRPAPCAHSLGFPSAFSLALLNSSLQL